MRNSHAAWVQSKIMEYLSYLQLDSEPFSHAPVSDYYYASRQHTDAERRLMHVAKRMKGLALLVADIGHGKTTLARRLLDDMPDEEFEAAMLVIVHGGVTANWLLKRIALQLGVDNPGEDKMTILSQLYTRLVEIHNQGRKAVVLIDEAQMLADRSVMEEFRGLLNLEVPGHKLISFIFLGLPEMEANLRLDPPLAQRVALRCQLAPLDAGDTASYVNHRLRWAGAKWDILPPDALEQLHRFSHGIPRVINTLADNVLLEMYFQGQQVATPRLVQEVAQNLGFDHSSAPALQSDAAGAPNAATSAGPELDADDIAARVAGEADAPLSTSAQGTVDSDSASPEQADARPERPATATASDAQQSSPANAAAAMPAAEPDSFDASDAAPAGAVDSVQPAEAETTAVGDPLAFLATEQSAATAQTDKPTPLADASAGASEAEGEQPQQHVTAELPRMVSAPRESIAGLVRGVSSPPPEQTPPTAVDAPDDTPPVEAESYAMPSGANDFAEPVGSSADAALDPGQDAVSAFGFPPPPPPDATPGERGSPGAPQDVTEPEAPLQPAAETGGQDDATPASDVEVEVDIDAMDDVFDVGTPGSDAAEPLTSTTQGAEPPAQEGSPASAPEATSAAESQPQKEPAPASASPSPGSQTQANPSSSSDKNAKPESETGTAGRKRFDPSEIDDLLADIESQTS